MCATTLLFLLHVSPLFFHPRAESQSLCPPSGFLDELSLQVFRCCTTSLQRCYRLVIVPFRPFKESTPD